MPLFELGDRVRVKSVFPPGHVRTPFFTRGKTGRITTILGKFGNPEALAYGGSGKPERVLYRVSFQQKLLWPDYDGSLADDVIADIYEHWLEPAHG